jgi:hypothetical protein
MYSIPDDLEHRKVLLHHRRLQALAAIAAWCASVSRNHGFWTFFRSKRLERGH